MAIKQGLLEQLRRSAPGPLADQTGSFKTSFAVLGGFALATSSLVPLLDREEPERRA